VTDEQLKARYELAEQIVRLVTGLQAEFKFYGGAVVNWNHAVVNGFTDSFEEMILFDVFGPLRAPMSGAKAVRQGWQDQIAREKIGMLFQANRLLVAELELSGLRYDHR